MKMATQYSSMAKFIGKNLISGKLKWSTVTTNKNFAPYADEALAYIGEKGYMIDEDGRCVPVVVED
jgi:hypothetical protein